MFIISTTCKLKLHRNVHFHENILKFCGVTFKMQTGKEKKRDDGERCIDLKIIIQ